MAFVTLPLPLPCPSAQYAVLYHPCTKVASYYLRVACICVHLAYLRCAIITVCILEDILHDIDEPRRLVSVCRAYCHCHRKSGRINCSMQLLCACNVPEPVVSYAVAPFLAATLKESTDMAFSCVLLLL